MRLLLINPITYDSIDSFICDSQIRKINSDEPISLMYLSAYIKRELPEITVCIYDWHIDCLKLLHRSPALYNDSDWLNFIKGHLYFLLNDKINEFKPDTVGVSGLYEYNAEPFHETLRIVKEVNKNIITVVGGIYPTTCDVSFDKNINHIIKSEAETKLKGLLKWYLEKEKHQNNKSIKSGMFLFVDGIIPKNDYIQNLNDLPLPDRSTIPTGWYASYGRQLTQRFYKDNCRTASVLISRGCVNACSYCSGHVITNRDYRHRSIENIVNEIKDLKEQYQIEVFNFQEENPCIDIKFTKSLYKALIPLKIKWVSQAGFYVHKMDYEFVKLAIDSGVLFFNLAIESGSKEILRKVKKPVGIIEKAPQVVKWIRELNPEISITGFFMINFPFETKEDINDTLNLIEKLDLNCVQWNSLQCFKGSELYNYCVERDLLDNKDNTENFYMNSRIKNENELTKEYIDNIINETNLKYNFINNYDFRHGYFERAKRFVEHVLSIDNNHLEAKKLLERIENGIEKM